MHQHNVPKYSEAILFLNDCHKMALSFQLLYREKPEDAHDLLHTLHATLTTVYKHLPPPQSTSSPSYDYATFYQCIYHLYHNPLTRIDIGNQMCVTQNYIDHILHAKTHLQT